jgi:hypothetical protein
MRGATRQSNFLKSTTIHFKNRTAETSFNSQFPGKESKKIS